MGANFPIIRVNVREGIWHSSEDTCNVIHVEETAVVAALAPACEQPTSWADHENRIIIYPIIYIYDLFITSKP